MGTLIKGLGADHVCWGTDAVWTGAPQWQIEGLRRLEIPEDMQKKHGFAPLGAADGPVKTAIFGGNNAKLYDIEPKRAHARTEPRSICRAEGRVREERPRAEQSAVRLRGSERPVDYCSVRLSTCFRPPKPSGFGGRFVKISRQARMPCTNHSD